MYGREGAKTQSPIVIPLEKFFDSVNHDILMERVVRKVKDKRVLRLIRRYLQAGLMKDGVTENRDDGTPQGGPLSPLLSNILLDALGGVMRFAGTRTSSGASHMNQAFPKKYFDELGLTSLLDGLVRRDDTRTAVYGTVRTVV